MLKLESFFPYFYELFLNNLQNDWFTDPETTVLILTLEDSQGLF